MKKIFYAVSIYAILILYSISVNAQLQMWGITTSGGSDDLGSIFVANADGTGATSVHSFTRTNPGSSPMYNQLMEYNNKFYSMTRLGGTSDLGVIFEWDPATNVYTKLHDFNGTAGSNPYGSLAVYNNKFYGMTSTGGANNLGVIFEWDPGTSTYTNMYDFNGTNGGNPYGSLLYDGTSFYGMTNTGGANSVGVIFEWDPGTNTYTKLHDFNGTDGGNPYGDLAVYGGKYYGLTNLGGVRNVGVIFEWDPGINTYTKKIDLGTVSSLIRYGDNPYGNLVLESGIFYYMTRRGGSSNSKGGIFEWDPVTNIVTRRIAFGGLTTTEESFGNLVFESGKFYGMGSIRGTGTNAQGGLFEWDPLTNAYSIKYQYSRNTTVHLNYNGATPSGSLVAKGGKLYGMTSAGGDNNKGVIFEYDPVMVTYTKKINFIASPGGKLPESGLSYDGTNIYGLTKQGGTEGLGTIFQWDVAAGQFNKQYDFNPATGNGRVPVGTMTLSGGKYYGVSFYNDVAPAYISRYIFEWDPGTSTYTPKVTLSGGQFPIGKMVEVGGFLYGMTSGLVGGTNGNIYRYDPVGNTLVSLYTFSVSANGVIPQGGLVESGGKLYGLTSLGGTNNVGVLFAWDIAGGTYTKLHNFAAGTGSNPNGTLVLNGAVLLGTTPNGGTNSVGVLFEWNIGTGTYTKLYDFSSGTGSNPNGFLIENAGKFYGMTTTGGANSVGVIYEWDPATSSYSKQSDFNTTNGKTPDNKNNLIFVPIPPSPRPGGGAEGSLELIGKVQNANVLSKKAVLLYPNPVVSNDLRVSLNLEKQGVVKFQIIDVNGRVVKNQLRQTNAGLNNFNIDVTRLARGIYFVNVESKGVITTLRFVKQ